MNSLDIQLTIAAVDQILADQGAHRQESMDYSGCRTFIVARWLRLASLTMPQAMATIGTFALSEGSSNNYGGTSREDLSERLADSLTRPDFVTLVAGLAVASRELAELLLEKAIDKRLTSTEDFERMVAHALDVDPFEPFE